MIKSYYCLCIERYKTNLTNISFDKVGNEVTNKLFIKMVTIAVILAVYCNKAMY